MIIRDKAIRNTHPTVFIINDGVDAYDKDGNKIELDESLISTEIDKLQAYMDSQAYIAKRQAEYPTIADQLDTIFHEGLDAWKEQIQAVKDKYPK